MLYNIVFSPTGGTQKVADILARELSKDITTIDLTSSDTDFSNYQFKDDDIAVISMPSFGGRAPQIAIERLKQIKSNNIKVILICVYGNRAYEDTLLEMKDVAQDLGFNVIAAISAVSEHSIVRQYGANRPDLKDKCELKEFALKIKERIVNSDNLQLEISGNRPYKKLGNVGIIPNTTKSCVNCMKCANSCPTGAISKNNVKIIDKNKCISCMRCIAICPHKAKKINKIMISIISFVLKKVCSARKENEFY